MDKKQAIDIIKQVYLQFRGTIAEHETIQKAINFFENETEKKVTNTIIEK